MCRGGNIIFRRSMRDSLIMFFSPTVRCFLTGQSFSSFVPSVSLWLCCPTGRWNKNIFFFFFTIFWIATCWPSKKLTIFRSTQMINSCSLFLRSSKTATTFAKHFEWNDDTQYTMNIVALEQTGWNDYTHEGNHFIKKNDNKSTFSFLKCYI